MTGQRNRRPDAEGTIPLRWRLIINGAVAVVVALVAVAASRGCLS